MNRFIVKDVKFDLQRCQVFNRDHCVNFLVTDISKTSVCENHIVFENVNSMYIGKSKFLS